VTCRTRNSALLFIVAGLAACARPMTPAAPGVIAPIRVQLADPDIAALAELLRMEDSRTLDVALVSRHLDSSTPEVRARSALAASRTGDPAAAPLLLRALGDADPSVRARAAFAIGELPDSSATAIAALTAVALRDAPHPAVEATHALGKLGARAAIDSILMQPQRQPRLVQEALLAAWRLPRDARTHAHLVRHSHAADVETRWTAAYALARTGGPPAVAPLLALVDDADEGVRAAAVRGLRASVVDSADLREPALAALLRAARDTHPHVRINAIGLLPAYRLPDRTGAVLAAALADADDNVAIAAAQALQQVRVPAASAPLHALLSSGRADGLRAAALHALARTDSVAVVAAAAQWADSSRWLVRMHAARALARASRAAATPALRRLARDSHYLVASEALTALRNAADSTHDARLLYVELMGATHPLVRAAAIRGLAPVSAADLDLLLQAFETARRDSIRDAAVAIVHALAAVGRAGVPVERSFFLRFASAPSDPVLYRTIADSIGAPPAAWGQPADRIRTRELAFYDDAIRRYVAPVLAGAEPPRAIITTAHGEILLDLASAAAPLTVHNFVTLVERGYYANTRWHRVVPNFVIQDGDPRGDGSGGPGYAIRDEINPLRYLRGTLGMALSGPDTGGSQFFITHSPQPHLDGGYTVFGQVSGGLDVVDRVVQDDAILGIRVVR
jgi:cyclophilin family peptidyl-prolyl cis-trans isomerase/HEAT repeat protein